MLRFQISDNGIGISSEDLARIFERYYRVRVPETENIEGTGLGLTIVKQLVDALGGIIDLESELGKGTTVSVYLPTASKSSNDLQTAPTA